MRISNLLPAAIAPLAFAAHLRLSIPASQHLPNPAVLPPSTSATLTTLAQIYTAPLRKDNTFDFRNISAGSYLLDIHAHTHSFAPLRVDVSDTVPGDGEVTKEKVEVWGTFRGNEWSNKGEVVNVVKVDGGEAQGFEGKCVGGKEYFIERAGFSPLGLLKNPMILIAGASMLVVFGMPYLMDNMDPEMRAEFDERRKTSAISSNAAPNPLQNFDAAAWLAGSSSNGGSTPKPKQVAAPAAEQGVTR